MRRREFIGLLGGAALWPHPGHAQPTEIRHLGALFVVAEPQAARWAAALKEGLQKAGWTEGQNLQINIRFGWSDPDRIRRYADELVALKPDVILAQGVVGAAILQRATKTIPVVFAQVQDPVGGGFV